LATKVAIATLRKSYNTLPLQPKHKTTNPFLAHERTADPRDSAGSGTDSRAGSDDPPNKR